MNDNDTHNDVTDPRLTASPEDLEAARLAIAELIIEAMDELIRAGEWNPHDGVAGLERLLLKAPDRDTKKQ